MMFGRMSAGSRIYIGSQGIVQGTYETFVEVGRRHYGADLPLSPLNNHLLRLAQIAPSNSIRLWQRPDSRPTKQKPAAEPHLPPHDA